MKKFMIVIITNKKDGKPVLNIIIVPINCTSNDERSIKHAIESRKNDPRTLTAIMMRDVPKALFPNVKSTLDKVEKLIKGCECIDVSFLNLEEEVKKFLETLKKDSILHDFHEN